MTFFPANLTSPGENTLPGFSYELIFAIFVIFLFNFVISMSISISRSQLTKDDVKVYGFVAEKPSADLYPNASKWYDAVSKKLAIRYFVLKPLDSLDPFSGYV